MCNVDSDTLEEYVASSLLEMVRGAQEAPMGTVCVLVPGLLSRCDRGPGSIAETSCCCTMGMRCSSSHRAHIMWSLGCTILREARSRMIKSLSSIM